MARIGPSELVEPFNGVPRDLNIFAGSPNCCWVSERETKNERDFG